MQHHTFYELDRLLLATLDAARSGQQPSAPWLSRAGGSGRPTRRRRARGLRPRPALAARPATDAGCR